MRKSKIEYTIKRRRIKMNVLDAQFLDKYLEEAPYDSDVQTLYMSLNTEKCKDSFVLDIPFKLNYPMRFACWLVDDFLLSSVLKTAVRQQLENHVSDFEKIRITIVRHSNNKLFVRFNALDICKVSGIKKARYKDMMLIPHEHGYRLLLPLKYLNLTPL
jgi:hypothetical protein